MVDSPLPPAEGRRRGRGSPKATEYPFPNSGVLTYIRRIQTVERQSCSLAGLVMTRRAIHLEDRIENDRDIRPTGSGRVSIARIVAMDASRRQSSTVQTRL